jgi:hypothetical protein
MLTTSPTWTLIDSTTDDTTGDLRASEPYQRFRWECADGRKAEATIRAYVYAHQHRDDERTVYGIEARVTVREYDSATPWASVETSAMPETGSRCRTRRGSSRSTPDAWLCTHVRPAPEPSSKGACGPVPLVGPSLLGSDLRREDRSVIPAPGLAADHCPELRDAPQPPPRRRRAAAIPDALPALQPRRTPASHRHIRYRKGTSMSENTDTARPNPDAHLLPRPERGWLGLILRGMPDVDASALDLGADERHPGTWWYGSLAALVPWFLSAVFLVLVGTVAPLLAISPIDLITKGERSGGGLATSVIGFVSLLLAILAVLFEVCPTPRRARATSFGFMLEREALFHLRCRRLDAPPAPGSHTSSGYLPTPSSSSSCPSCSSSSRSSVHCVWRSIGTPTERQERAPTRSCRSRPSTRRYARP